MLIIAPCRLATLPNCHMRTPSHMLPVYLIYTSLLYIMIIPFVSPLGCQPLPVLSAPCAYLQLNNNCQSIG